MTVSSSNIRSNTYESSPMGPSKFELNKEDTNDHAKFHSSSDHEVTTLHKVLQATG